MLRRAGIISMIVLTSFLLGGATSPQSCNTSNSQPTTIGPSKGEVVGAAVAVVAVVVVATVVLVEVHNSHHTIKGCVSMGPSGLKGETDQGFVIQKISKNYGACQVTAVQAAATPSAAATPAP
jgi:hypothetical protein